MVVVIMKDENNKMYNNVVVENFLKYLKKKGITQKKYAQDNNMDKPGKVIILCFFLFFLLLSILYLL